MKQVNLSQSDNQNTTGLVSECRMSLHVVLADYTFTSVCLQVLMKCASFEETKYVQCCNERLTKEK